MKHLNLTLTSLISQLHSKKTPLNSIKSSITKAFIKKHEDVWLRERLITHLTEDETVTFVKKLPRSGKQMVNDQLYLNARGITIEASQTYTGELIDRTRRQTNRYYAALKEVKLYDTYTRGKNRTAITKLAYIFQRPSLWFKLQHDLPVCRSLVQGFILFAGLLSTPKQLSKWAHVSESKKYIYKYNNKEKKNIVSTNSGVKNTPKTEPPKVAATAEQAKAIIDAFLATLG